ncbi:polyprenol phosphomannose-dependent alpha 1,6 mannosyltransferase MptB [Catellatospora tritici]|uniref:polyprenol phosphomannose-dependent alpha 1,6 mannosyltransferase MptB n=1 Tax=Catellatospora tritici TaxID=2851566 RepID=UPI001C2DDEE5|nr:polyprenol phosphomannose-dependent alpha 1,6 mannosyltransferase MptB [Catellatospora tritici]MBV1855262.1 polyprenol phosphomannose-dependent alpha 1,6 mannosyltransferase MptB [Catellatospora tritici]
MPDAPATADARGCRLLGFAGSAALALGGLAAGALPVRDTLAPVLGLSGLRQHEQAGLVCAYFGLALLSAAWWRLGRAVRGPRPPDPRSLLVTLAVWAAPLLVVPPLFSRDVYSYLAQGAMVGAGIDVYEFGPSRLGGPLSAEVPPVWQHTPTPYGPAFLALASAVARAVDTDVPLGVFGMRAVALAGVVLLLVCLPRLARACHVDPAAALWLGGLNPLVLLHLVGGAHNDAVMLGLLVAGLTAAAAARFGTATVLITLASLVKAPAALGLVVVGWLWRDRLPRLDRLPTPHRIRGGWSGEQRALPVGGPPAGRRGVADTLAALGLILLFAAATTVAVTAVTGTGYGWLRSLNTPVSSQNWSLSSTFGRITRNVLHLFGSDLAPLAIPAWRWLGLAAAVAVTGYAWRAKDRASRSAIGHSAAQDTPGCPATRVTLRRRFGPVYALGLSLTALALLGPALRPWYLLWGLIPIAAAAPDGRVRRWAAVACLLFAVLVFPSGFTPRLTDLAAALAGALLAVPVLVGLSAGLAAARRREPVSC